MRRTCACLLVLGLAGCASKQPAATPIVQRPAPPARPAAPTCADAGVILRGDLIIDDAAAGPAKEKAIAQACRADRWAQAVIDCVASQPHPHDCLDALSEAQHAGYDKRVEAWSAEYELTGGTGTAMRTTFVDCADTTRDSSHFPPALDDASAERAWQLKVRGAWLAEECEHSWLDELKECIVAAGEDTDRIRTCLANGLDEPERDEIANRLAEIDHLAAKIAAAKQKPASITCKQLVATHYADARWKQKLDGFKPADRKQMIAASRDAMAKACTADRWDDTLRACVIAGGADACFDGTAKRRWGYPATGTVTAVGIPECDDYSAEAMKLATCTQIEQSARDSIVRSQQQMLAEIARLPAAERAKMASGCKAGMDAIQSSLGNAGC